MKAKILTPKQAAIRDMRAAGLDTTVLRRTVIVEEKWYRIFKDELERRRTGQLETSYSL